MKLRHVHHLTFDKLICAISIICLAVVLVLFLVLKNIFQVLVLVLVLGGQVLVLVLGGQVQERSGGSTGSVPLYCASLALCWLSALYIALCRLPIALVWLPTTRFFITRAPNRVTRLEIDLQPQVLHWLPALAPSPTYGHTLTPYPDSLQPVLPQGFP